MVAASVKGFDGQEMSGETMLEKAYKDVDEVTRRRRGNTIIKDDYWVSWGRMIAESLKLFSIPPCQRKS